MDTGHGPEEHQEDYSFMQETFKDEQVSPRKVLMSIFKWIAIGVLFGCAACIAFYALKPWAEETFQAEPNRVEIQDGEEDLMEHEENEPDDSDEENPEVNDPDTENPDGEQNVEQPITQIIEKELTLEDFYVLNNEMKKISKEAQRCIVTISGLEESSDWTSSRAGVLGDTAGLIVADNGRELLILSNYSVIKETQLFQVELVDGTQHQATLKQKDVNLDIAVFSVAKDSVSEETWEKISIAEFGSSSRVEQGRTLVAVGQPFGFHNGIGFGVASTVDETVIHADGQYDVIVTNMAFSGKGSGFLFDLSGKVMGYVDPKLNSDIGAGTLVAYGISDIIDEIELMSNGKHVPYAGIVGVMVDEAVSELYGIPVGLYVTEVEQDSPAMKAGIQNGDVITMIGEEEILSLDFYHELLYSLEAGQSVKFKGNRYGTEEYVGIDFTVTIGIKE